MDRQYRKFYYVQYKESTSSSWVTAASAITITTLDISNLLMGKTYDWRVSANCDNTNSGNYAASQFGTSSRNNQITNIKNGIGIKISPNPVMGSNAIIDYSVSENGKVEIAVVNSVGQVVKKLEQANRTAGQYSFTITNQLDNLASGAYYLKLTQNKKHNSILFVKVP
ncbi:MAG: T9SS type A sorting domain-containing protein [Chitinophagaceae bacterium]|nr:T9SS type A sorting domain-containing protein [Chitinophagaceae bacterium]